MQDKNRKMVKRILLSIASHLDIDGLKGLADYLGEPTTRIYSWVRNGSIADTGSILAKIPGINHDWLKTGSGPMLLDNNQQPTGQSEVVAKEVEADTEKEDEAGEGEHVQLFGAENQPPISKLLQMVAMVIEYDSVFRPALASNIVAFYLASGWKVGRQAATGRSSLSELLVMTSKILESRTVYRNALVSNVVAFHQAVMGEIEMKKLRDEMATIREQNADIMERLARIEADQQVMPDQQAKKREAV